MPRYRPTQIIMVIALFALSSLLSVGHGMSLHLPPDASPQTGQVHCDSGQHAATSSAERTASCDMFCTCAGLGCQQSMSLLAAISISQIRHGQTAVSPDDVRPWQQPAEQPERPPRV